MSGGTYVSALLQLTQHPSEAVIRRALKLLTASLTKLGQQDARPSAEVADDASQGSAEAALQLCNLAPTLLQTGSSWLASCSTAALSHALHDAVRQKHPGFHNILLMAVLQCQTLRAVSSMHHADLPLLLFSNCHIQLACLLQLYVAQAARHMDVDSNLPHVISLKAEWHSSNQMLLSGTECLCSHQNHLTKQFILCAGDGSKQLGASTRQAVLIAVSGLGDALGSAHPKPFIAVLPALVAAAKDTHRSVRSSALAAAASCLAALGSAALPLLPKLVPAVLAAAQTAVDSLPISTPTQVLLPWCMSALWHSDVVQAPEQTRF